jgi:hypothetical protein
VAGAGLTALSAATFVIGFLDPLNASQYPEAFSDRTFHAKLVQLNR